jgi:ribosome-associated protein
MAKTARALKAAKITNPTDELTELAIKALQEKKGHEITCLDLRQLKTSITDMFIVCHGDSTTQVDALARSVEDVIYKETGENPMYKEGAENAQWILLDYINVVIHIFQKEFRDYYGIERLWADAQVRQLPDDKI